MSKNSVSDFVAAAMDAALKSAEYKTLFNTQYKFASHEGKDECEKCHEEKEACECGDDSHAHDAEVEEVANAWDNNDADMKEDEEVKAEAAFNVAIDSLLTASAALDSVGMEKTATFSLKLASLVVEAKKKEEDKKKKDKKSDSNDARAKAKEKAAKEKEKAAKEKAKEKEKRDAQMAKDKAVKEKEKEKLAKEKEKAKEKAAKEKAAKEKASKK